MSARLRTPGRVLLVASLALNVFALGAYAAGWWNRSHDGDRRHERSGRMLGVPDPRQLGRALPESARPLLRETLDAHRAPVRERLEGLTSARREVAGAMRAEPYDRARLEQAFAALRARETEVAEAAQAMICDLMDKLGRDDRARIAELLPARGPRHKKHDPTPLD